MIRCSRLGQRLLQLRVPVCLGLNVDCLGYLDFNTVTLVQKVVQRCQYRSVSCKLCKPEPSHRSW